MTCQGCRLISNSKSGQQAKKKAKFLVYSETDKKKKDTEEKKKKRKIEYMQTEQASGLAASHSFSSACPVPLTSHWEPGW